MSKTLATLTLLGSLLLLGCAQPFPRPNIECCTLREPNGHQIFNKAFMAHGGSSLKDLKDVSFALDGEWKFLITRIQPLVTDHKYRVVSEERLLPHQGVYAAFYRGPAGTKKVVRTREKTRVFYNGDESYDQDVLQSTALTADSFFIFLLGPLALRPHAEKFARLPDVNERGRDYWRIHAELSPGIGESTSDEIVLWIDQKNHRVFRVHITLEGYHTTQGAHVDVTYLDYQQRGTFIFPSRFHERVRGPIAIDAHSWYLTGLDINRGLNLGDIDGAFWQGPAETAAQPLQHN